MYCNVSITLLSIKICNYSQELCFQNLRLRGISISDYIQKMINRTTNGLDLTMIIMSRMLDLTTVCLWRKYMWISAETDLHKCDVYLTLMKGGHFSSACPKQGYKIVVKIPEECRPMYLTSDSMRDTTYVESDHILQPKSVAGNNFK